MVGKRARGRLGARGWLGKSPESSWVGVLRWIERSLRLIEEGARCEFGKGT